jgi:PIN domain nuclease of toxin-antitoxin system
MTEEEADAFIEGRCLMRLLLDTVTFLWALEAPEPISGPAMSVLASAKAVPEISAVSLSQMAIMQALGKLTFLKADLLDGISDLRLRVLPYTAEHAFGLFDLSLRHHDLFDRQIIAQALVENILVVSSDRTFALYKGLRVLW